MTQLLHDFILYPDDYYHLTNWKSFHMEEHHHSALEINYVVKGTCTYYVGNERLVLRRGNLLILNSVIPHKMIFGGNEGREPCSVMGVSLVCRPPMPGTLVLGELVDNNESLSGLFDSLGDYMILKNAVSVLQTLEQLVDECTTIVDGVYINVLVSKLLLEVSRISQNLNTNNFDHILEIKEYIKRDYRTINSIQDIASQVCLNKTYLQRIFKQQVGCTVLQYMTNIRMQQAATLLRDTDISIGDIDSYIGLNSRHNFYLLFRKSYGMSPSDFRRLHRENNKNPQT